MNFWTFLFLLIVFGWIGMNSDSKAGQLARMVIIMAAKRLFGRKEALPDIEKNPDTTATS